MSRHALALAAVLLLAACHRDPTVDAPDADADLRARTAAKTSADLETAEAAARVPLPRPVVDRPREQPVADDTSEPPAGAVDGNIAD